MALDTTKPVVTIKFNVGYCDTPELLKEFIAQCQDDPYILFEMMTGDVKTIVTVGEEVIIDETVEGY